MSREGLKNWEEGRNDLNELAPSPQYLVFQKCHKFLSNMPKIVLTEQQIPINFQNTIDLQIVLLISSKLQTSCTHLPSSQLVWFWSLLPQNTGQPKKETTLYLMLWYRSLVLCFKKNDELHPMLVLKQANAVSFALHAAREDRSVVS